MLQYVQVMRALLDLYITSYEVKNLKRNRNILNVKRYRLYGERGCVVSLPDQLGICEQIEDSG